MDYLPNILFAIALATGEAAMPIPESVKVTFKGSMKPHMDFRDIVHATQAQMLEEFEGADAFLRLFNVIRPVRFDFSDCIHNLPCHLV